MSSAARIEELQKKFDENPRRYFAPLANECRKAGDLDAAIAICRTHLPQQPGHMSGHIVYGQALFESGELDEARTVFETALGLDPENLIALRHMGDIAARHGDMAAARQWYVRVLETDPRNEEIQTLVAGLGEQPVPPAAGSDSGAPAFDLAADELGFDEPPADPEDLPRVRGGLPTLVDPALLAAAAEAVPESEAPYAALADAGRETEVLDLGGTGFDAGPMATSESEAAAGADTPRDELLEPTALEFEAPSVDAGMLEGLEATTFEAPSAGEASSYERVGDEALLDDVEAPAAQVEGLESAEFDASSYGAGDLEPIAAPSFEFEPADAGPLQDPPDSAPSGEAFVTETMAELYLRQGYRDEALDVYRKLVNQSPDDGALRSRMERVESDVAADHAAARPVAFDAMEADGDDVIAGLPQAIAPALVAAAAEAGAQGDESVAGPASTGPTIREFLSALAAGGSLPSQRPEAETDGGWEVTGTADFGDTGEISAGPDDSGGGAVAGIAELPVAGEVAEVVDLGEFDLAEPEPEPEAEPEAEVEEEEVEASQGGGLDALFGEARAEDIRAADALASAYLPLPAPLAPAPVAESHAASPVMDAAGEPAADPLRGRPARPAGNDLSLDHVFGAPRQQGSTRNTGGFSFDQFFADGAAKPARDEPPEQPAAAGDEEDLEQFNSWLHNLRKP